MSPLPPLLHEIFLIFRYSSSQISVVFFTFIMMMKGEKSNAVSGAGKGEVAAEEKGKKSSHHTRVCLNFDSKTTKLHSQEEVDEYLKKHGV